MELNEFQTKRTAIISRMLDNPDEHGIYPTTECFKELDELFLSMTEENQRLKDAVKYMISVWDEVTGKTWREKPDHVQQKFLIAEEALKPNPNEQVIMSEDSGVKADNLVRYFKRFIKDKKY